MIDVLEELADDAIDAHTSIVLAYNVDLLVYDKLLRRQLAASGVTSQINAPAPFSMPPSQRM